MGPQHIRQDHACTMINRMPEPSLLRFLLNKAPHFIYFRFFHLLDLHENRIGLQLLEYSRVDMLNSWRFFLTP